MRVACVTYANRQGLGWLGKRFFDAGIITDPIIYRHAHPQRKFESSWYPSDTPIIEPAHHRGFSNLHWFRDRLKDVQVLLAFETFFDWHAVAVARELGVKTVLMPMHEWTPSVWPVKPDYILAPSLLDLDYFRDEFPGHIAFLPVPVDNSTWQQRGIVKAFLHNAGNVGHREHKGTRQFVEAIPLVKADCRFLLKAQDGAALTSILNDNPAARDDPRLTVDLDGNQPWERMWDGAECYVAPEKLNGLSLPLAEAYAAGLVVITTDRYPANTWLPKKPLIEPASKHQACISRNYRPFEECVIEPAAVAGKIDLWTGRNVTEESQAAQEWGVRNNWQALKAIYLDVLSAMAVGRGVSELPAGTGW